MSDIEWPRGTRALLPVTVTSTGENSWVQVVVGHEADGYYLSVDGADLISDDRRPSWLPGHPGDVAEWAGFRWLREGYAEWWLLPGQNAIEVSNVTDDDVPADAVLVLPARSREVAP